MKTIIFLYNMKAIVSYIFLGILFSVLIVPVVIGYEQIIDTPTLIFMTAIALAMLAGVYIIIVKRLRPALQHKAALELNESKFIYHIKYISLEWKDIQDIELRNSRNSWYLYITLTGATDIKSDIIIDLDMISGSPDGIYNRVLDYFHQTQIR
jgi:hypothetical protein